MATDKVSFRKIKHSFNKFLQNRDPAGSTVTTTGRTHLNAAASELLTEMATKAGSPLDKLLVLLGADDANGRLAIYVATDSLEEGATPARYDAATRTFSIHFGSVFREIPTLRPISQIQCPVSVETDDEETACLVLNLSTAHPKRRVSRKGSPAAVEAAPGKMA